MSTQNSLQIKQLKTGKLLAPAERITKDYWSFVALTFKKLKDERISPSSVLRENKKLLVSFAGQFPHTASNTLTVRLQRQHH
jgi:hypothetical protein